MNHVQSAGISPADRTVSRLVDGQRISLSESSRSLLESIVANVGSFPYSNGRANDYISAAALVEAAQLPELLLARDLLQSGAPAD